MPKLQISFISWAGKNSQSQLSSGRGGRCLPQGTVKAEPSKPILQMHRANYEAAEPSGSSSSSQPFVDSKPELLLCRGRAAGGGCTGGQAGGKQCCCPPSYALGFSLTDAALFRRAPFPRTCFLCSGEHEIIPFLVPHFLLPSTHLNQ